MISPSASFRTVVGTVIAVVGAVAVATAAALVLLTTELRQTTGQLRAVLEGVRLAEDAAVDLLLHDRLEQPLGRRALERDLREKLEAAERLATSERHRDVLRSAREQVDAYLAAEAGEEAVGDAFAALEELVAFNARAAQAAEARAHRLDRVGDVVGVATAVLFLVSTAWLLWWLRARAFRPLLSLAEAMRRFGSGEAGARAPAMGPAELRDMARRFNEMATALEAMRRRQMTFLAAFAHDLRNPVSALKLATGRPAGAAAAEATLVLVRRQVLRLERLVSDLIDTARIEAGEIELHPQPVDVRAIVESVVSLFGATSDAHRISVTIPDEQVIASCDPGRVEQVLDNLVSNAIKYSPRGGRIEIVVEPRPGAVRVAVADEGVGIPDGEAEAIFEPFRRGHGAAPDVPGVGLGLYVSRRIVEAHGGELHVASTPGRGSTFELVLPR